MKQADSQIIALLEQIKAQPTGVTNTGNATVGDVASGKTFSSAVLTNATGISTKNATVPNNAVIQPPPAFVDNIGKFAAYVENSPPGFVNLSGQGIASIDAAFVIEWAKACANANGAFNLSIANNALSAANVNALLAACVDSGLGSGNQINLSGGTNAAPTGQGLTDKATLIAAGWAVATN